MVGGVDSVCTAPATVLPVTLDDAKNSLRADGNALDSQITIWLEGIVADMEFEIGQRIMQQGWQVTLSAFRPEIPLPHPAQAVTAVRYKDAAGTLQTLASGAYSVRKTRYRSWLVPADGQCWPAAKSGYGAVQIDLLCGYGTTPDATPRNIRLYILAKLVEQFDPVAGGEKGGTPSPFIQGLLDACRSRV